MVIQRVEEMAAVHQKLSLSQNLHSMGCYREETAQLGTAFPIPLVAKYSMFWTIECEQG